MVNNRKHIWTRDSLYQNSADKLADSKENTFMKSFCSPKNDNNSHSGMLILVIVNTNK